MYAGGVGAKGLPLTPSSNCFSASSLPTLSGQIFSSGASGSGTPTLPANIREQESSPARLLFFPRTVFSSSVFDRDTSLRSLLVEVKNNTQILKENVHFLETSALKPI